MKIFILHSLKNPIQKDVSLVKKEAYIKIEEWFNNKYNNYTVEFWDNIELNEEIMSDIKSVKNGTKLISALKNGLSYIRVIKMHMM